jgi:predicted MFS family arabinose efflux permease
MKRSDDFGSSSLLIDRTAMTDTHTAPQRQHHNMTLAIVAVGATAATGLPLGGVLLAQAASSHWIFWLLAALAIATTVTTMTFVPESPVRSPGKVDLLGAAVGPGPSPDPVLAKG